MWRRKALLVAIGFGLAACGAGPDGVPARMEGDPPVAVGQRLSFEGSAPLSYPEGPLIADGVLHIAEMGGGRVARRTLDGEDLPPWTLPACGPTALAPYGEGFVVLCHLTGDLAVIDRQGREQRRIGTFDGVALRNPNDGASDLRGGVYFSDPGDFYRPRQPVGRVVRLDPNGRLHAVASGLNYPNGVYVVEDAAGRFAYVSEHFSRRILRYPINADGSFGPMSVWAVIPEQGPGARFTYDQAGPDGLERGPDGAWYVAIYGEGRVLRLNRDGLITGEIATPFQYVTNMATAETGVYVVGPYVHDRAPFEGGAMFAPYAAFGPIP